MEDSGYCSHRSGEFKISSGSGVDSHSGRIPSPDVLFQLTFQDLCSSPFSYLRHGFTGEEDFEDFKRELRDFRRLKREAREAVGDSDPPSPPQHARGEGDRNVGRHDGVVNTVGSSRALDDSSASVKERGDSGRGVCIRKTGGDVSRENGVRVRAKDSNNEFRGDSTPSGDKDLEAPGSTTPLKRSVSLRSHSGGARARVTKKRNGVYFDDDFGIDYSSPPKESRALSPSTQGEIRGNESSVKVSGCLTHPVATSSVLPQDKRKPGRRRVRFCDAVVDNHRPLKADLGFDGTGFGDSSHDPGSLQDTSHAARDDTGLACLETSVVRCGRRAERKGRSTFSKTTVSVRETASSEGDLSNKCNDRHVQPVSPGRQTRLAVLPLCAENKGTTVCGVSRSDPTVERNVSAAGQTLPNRLGFVDGNNTNKVEESCCLRLAPCPVSGQKEGKSECLNVCTQKQNVDSVANGLCRRREKPPIGNSVVQNDHRIKERTRNGLSQERERSKENNLKDSVNKQDEISSRRLSKIRNSKRLSLIKSLKRLSNHCDRPGSRLSLEWLMEFFSGDEHFQEFERVFETINNRRFSRDNESWGGEDRSDPSEEEDCLAVLHIDETFLDFFDNDEDFQEFERELEKIQSGRRSRLLENLSGAQQRPICDTASEFPHSDVRPNSQSIPGSSPKMERRLSASNSSDYDLWNSAEEWEVVMNRLRKNSRLFANQRAGSLRRSKDCLATVEDCPVSQCQESDGVGGRLCPGSGDCHYTCHSHCVASVSLDCTVVSPGSGDGPVASPTDFPSSKGSDETALTSVITQTSFRQPQPSSSTTSNSSSQAVSQRQGVQQLPPPGGARRCSSPLENASSSSSIKSDLIQSASSCTLPATTALSCGDSSDGVSSAGGRDVEDTSDAANEKDETDSGYRSGTIPDEKLPKAPSQATLNRRELQRKIQAFNHFVPKAKLEMMEDGISSQGFIWVTLNLVRPITMELGARPPSIYELLTREHIIEQSTQHIAFYMPRDTVKSMHITSKTTTREVITGLLKKFHILDNPRKFAMYEQEFNDKNKLVKLRRLTDKDFPLLALLSWEPERIKYYRLVLQENETGEIVWNAFSTPELKNFLVVLDREEGEAIAQLQYKYRVMKRIISQRMKELRNTPAHESKA